MQSLLILHSKLNAIHNVQYEKKSRHQFYE